MTGRTHPRPRRVVLTGPHGICLGMSEYVANGSPSGCLSSVIDQLFDNPPHLSRYDVGSCENWVKRQRNEECEIHQEERHDHSDEQQGSLEIAHEEIKHEIP